MANRNEEIEKAITEHLKEQLQKDLSPDETAALKTKVAAIREIASE